MTSNIKYLITYFLIFLFCITVAFAEHVFNQEAIQGMSSQEIQFFSQSEVEHNLQSIEKTGKISELTPEQISPNIDKLSENGLKQLTKDQLYSKDSSGNPNINKVKDWKKLDKNARDETLKEITGRSITTEEPVGGKVIGNGVEFEAIKFWKIDKTSINNCIKCSYNGIKLKFKHADSVLTDKSASTNIDNFEGFADIFSVEKADSFLSDCIRVDNIKDSEFKITNKVEVTTKSDVDLKITDCSYNEVEFKGKGKIAIDKSSDNPQYILENGTLTKKENNYNETIESNNSAIIETDKTFGFKCLTITPVGSYFYNDNDLRKDFIINIPKESSTYKLCLRKNQAQNFQDYNGLVDFVDKKIELNGIVNYLRYPLKNNQISSLLSSFVYKGLQNVNVILSYDNNLIFLNNIFLTNKNNIKNQNLSITYPSNFYTIKEMEIDGEIHSIVELNLNLKKEDLTQNINYEYKTNYFEPKVSIKDNVFAQDNGKNRITILPPEYNKINEILENVKKQ